MMGWQSGQMSMVILDMAELIPSDHLLRKINQMISFDFIYDLVAPYYPANGRPWSLNDLSLSISISMTFSSSNSLFDSFSFLAIELLLFL